jgi:gamma-butyrobetaine dioxygenase
MATTVIDPVALEEGGLSVDLPGLGPSYFNIWWLRDNCPSSFDPETRERVFDIFHHDATPRPEDARLDDGALVIRWAGEGHVSRYPLGMLATYADGARRPDPADLPRRPWFADHYPQVTRVSQPALLEDAAERRRWMEALLVEGIAIVTDMPDSDEGLTRTAELLGTIRPSFFGAYFDVRTHVKPTNLAYTSK